MSSAVSGASLNRFYRGKTLTTQVGTLEAFTLLMVGQVPIAQVSRGQLAGAMLLAVDEMQHVLACQAGLDRQHLSYSPYGFNSRSQTVLAGFSGQAIDQITGYSLLGAGYRAYSPELMRFNSPDSWSPFGAGGVNCYAYVSCEPISHVDPTGHMQQRRKSLPAPQTSVEPRRRHSTAPLRSPLPSRLASTGSSTSDLSKSSGSLGRLTSSNASSTSQLSGHSNVSAACTKGWKLDKSKATFKVLTSAEQQVFDTFQNAIHHHGMSPKEAAIKAGDTNYKFLSNAKIQNFQIRLSQSQRVSGEISGNTAIIRQVGGHT